MRLEYYYNKSGISGIAESKRLIYSYWQFLEVVFCKEKYIAFVVKFPVQLNCWVFIFLV